MIICTTFFNNEQYYLNNYIRWYEKLFPVKKFIFFIGESNIDEFNWQYKQINFFIKNEGNIIILKYKSICNSPSQWHFLKTIFWSYLNEFHANNKILFTDCDELIYSNNINLCIEQGFIKTHFYEHVPINNFSLDTETTWSVCPWYYREQSLNNANINHHNCKIFNLNAPSENKHMGHLSDSYCNSNFSYTDYNNVCWHVGIHSREHYLNSKHWLQTEPELKVIERKDQNNNFLYENFEKFYKFSKFDTFNLKLSYIYNV